MFGTIPFRCNLFFLALYFGVDFGDTVAHARSFCEAYTESTELLGVLGVVRVWLLHESHTGCFLCHVTPSDLVTFGSGRFFTLGSLESEESFLFFSLCLR